VLDLSLSLSHTLRKKKILYIAFFKSWINLEIETVYFVVFRFLEFLERESEMDRKERETMKETKFQPPLPPRSPQINRKNCGIYSVRCDRHVHFGAAWNFEAAKTEETEKLARGYHTHKALQKSFFQFGIPMLEFRIEQKIDPSHMGRTVLPLKQFERMLERRLATHKRRHRRRCVRRILKLDFKRTAMRPWDIWQSYVKRHREYERKISATRLQTWWRDMAALKASREFARNRVRQNAARVIARFLQHCVASNFGYIVRLRPVWNHAASEIQRVWRGHYTRFCVENRREQDKAATRIQVLWRTRLERKTQIQKHRERASLMITSMFRIHQARTIARVIRERYKAIALQRRARVFLARKKATRLKEAKVAVILQRHCRRWLCKRRALELRKVRASTHLAAFFRGTRARALARVLRKRFQAAVRIQSCVRTYFLVCTYRNRIRDAVVRSRRIREHKCAVKIQNVWRCHAARRVLRCKRAIQNRSHAIFQAIEICIQATRFATEEATDAREFVNVAQEVRYSIQNRVARVIQARVRMYLARRRVLMIRYERDLARRARRAGLNLRASKIQCSWRQRIARTKVTRMRLKKFREMEMVAAKARALAERQRRNKAATRIQSSIRALLATKNVKARRKIRQEQIQRLKKQSATLIQSTVRMWIQRQTLSHLRFDRLERLKIMCQAQNRIRKCWRAYSLRNYIRCEIERKQRDCAARTIQRFILNRKKRLEPVLRREKMCPQHWIRKKISPTKIVYEHLLTRRTTRSKPKTFLKSGGRVRFMPQDVVSSIPVWTQFWSSKAAVSMFYIHRKGKFARNKPKDVDTILHDGKKRFVKLWDTTTRSNYFLDIKSGSVSWKDPTLIEKKEENENENEDEDKGVVSWTGAIRAKRMASKFHTSLGNLGESMEEQQEDEKDDDKEEEKWIEYVDEESGAPYWYNTKTKESKWESPEKESHSDEVWTTHVDEESGATYWWNSETNVMTWNSPHDHQEHHHHEKDSEWEAFEDPESGAKYLVNKISGESKWQEENDEMTTPKEWSAYYDEETESCYWYNSITGEVSYNTPGFEDEEKKDAVVLKKEEENEEKEKEEEGPEWTSYVDEETGETFYWNRITNETSWTSPYEEKEEEKEDDTVDTAPHAWVAYKDDFGNVYYWNHETGLSQWSEPENYDSTYLENDRQIWETHNDEDGNVYYYNTRTGETSWIAPDAQQEEQGAWRRFDDEDGNTFYYNIHTGESSWVIPEDESDEQNIVEMTNNIEEVKVVEWQSHQDSQGNEYFWNCETGESVWEIPDTKVTQTVYETSQQEQSQDGFVTETTDGWLTEATAAETSVKSIAITKKRNSKQSGERSKNVLPFSTDEGLSSGYTTEETYRP